MPFYVGVECMAQRTRMCYNYIMKSITIADYFVEALLSTRISVARVASEAFLFVFGLVWLTVLSQVALPLPFTPVMVSLGTFSVLSIGAAYGAKRSAYTLSAWALLGFAGVPVFQGFKAGFGLPTMGYVVGYIFAAVLVGAFSSRLAQVSHLKTFAVWAGASLAIYIPGTLWLMHFMSLSLADGLAKGVYPFLIGDVVKVVAAAGIFPVLYKFLKRITGEKQK